ncbi:MAG: dihydrolipoyl dehydrogenase [Bacillota bacterium]
MKKYDLIVLGGGTAGMNLLYPLTDKGWDVALVEASYIGGTCINVGCIPSKTLISSGKVMQMVREAKKWGVVTGSPQANWPAMVERKEQLVGKIRARGYKNVEGNEKITLYEGQAAFSAPDTVTVNGDAISADKIVIASGARTAVPPVVGLDEIDYLTSTSVMEMETLPDSMIILGGGIIALEFSQLFNRLGVEVTIVQRGSRLAPNLNPEISEEIRRIIEAEGVKVKTDTKISSAGMEAEAMYLIDETESGPERYMADKILVAAGRAPNTDMLDLEKAGVKTNEKGYIKVDEAFKTSAEGIYAIGDVIGGMMFTHKAWHDATLLSRYLSGGEKISAENRLIPFAVFTEPEIAGAGHDEAAAANAGYKVKIHHYPFRFQGRARAMEKYDGFIKMTVEEDSGKILGAHMIGPEAGELIHELITAMHFKATVQDIKEMIHIHPTLSEAILNTASAG